jgi:hypothetical protein
MERAFIWIASVLIAAALSSPAATARDLGPEMRVLLGHFQEQRRIAMAYLRTDNVDLGAIEIETLRDRWLADRRAIEAAVAADRELAGALAATENAVLASLQAVEAADSPRALVLLDEAAIPLGAWRKSNGIRLFSDCIAEVSVAFEPLDRYRSPRTWPQRAARSSSPRRPAWNRRWRNAIARRRPTWLRARNSEDW